MSAGPTVVTSAFPFAPAELGVAHFASTYVPADVQRRFLECLGVEAVHVCGTDVHSIELSSDGKSVSAAGATASHERYRRQFAAVGIDFDVHVRMDHPHQLSKLAVVLARLRERGALRRGPATVLRCAACGAFLPRRYALDADGRLRGAERFDLAAVARAGRCRFCGERHIEVVSREHWYLRVDPVREWLRELAVRQVQADTRDRLTATLGGELGDWDFTRDHAFGLRLPFDASQSVYVWMSSLVGYLTLAELAGARLPGASFQHFVGKNILYHHGVLWPIVLREGAGMAEPDVQISARGFQDLARSDRELVELDLALERWPADYLRFYLTQRVPDRTTDFALSADELRRTCNKLLVNKVGNLLNRLWTLLGRADGQARLDPGDPRVGEFYARWEPALRTRVERMETHAALNEVMAYVQALNRRLSTDAALRDAASERDRGALAFFAASTLTLVRPVVPALAASFGFFDGWEPRGVAAIPEAVGHPLGSHPSRWQKV